MVHYAALRRSDGGAVKQGPRDVGASVRARLLERARREQSDFQLLLTRYVLERLLYRLSASKYRDRYILKGALLLATWVGDNAHALAGKAGPVKCEKERHQRLSERRSETVFSKPLRIHAKVSSHPALSDTRRRHGQRNHPELLPNTRIEDLSAVVLIDGAPGSPLAAATFHTRSPMHNSKNGAHTKDRFLESSQVFL